MIVPIFVTLLALAALAAIFMNLESWPARIVWIIVLAAALVFTPGSGRIASVFAVVFLLSTYQSIKNRRIEKAEREAEEQAARARRES